MITTKTYGATVLSGINSGPTKGALRETVRTARKTWGTRRPGWPNNWADWYIDPFWTRARADQMLTRPTSVVGDEVHLLSALLDDLDRWEQGVLLTEEEATA